MTVLLTPPDSEQQQQFARDGFLMVAQILSPERLPQLHQAFDALFEGDFETGVRPDEVNWQQQSGDPTLTRQICNGWKANRTIARVVLDQQIGASIAALAGWSGCRVMIDNVIWKPSGTRALGYHQDNAYLSWFTPSELLTCWIALDQTREDGGTLEFVEGSNRWPLSGPTAEFHGPEQYQAAMQQAAQQSGFDPSIRYVEVAAGGGSFHHGRTWHGSGPNRSDQPRRALVIHAMRDDVEYVPENFDQGIGPIYSRYKRLADNQLDENYFPITWRQDGYRTASIERFLQD